VRLLSVRGFSQPGGLRACQARSQGEAAARRVARAGSPVRDDGEPGLGFAELARDHELDVVLKWGVGAEDELAEDGKQGPVLAREFGELGPGGVEQPDRVVGQV
jgi:hypothetical protein